MKRKSLLAPRWMLFFSRHVQAIRISFNQLSLSPIATIMTFAVIGIALALPMGLSVLLKNVKVVELGLHDSAQISLYLDMSASKNDVKKLMRLTKGDKSIASVNYISPKEGLKQFQKSSHFGDVLSALKQNPLPGVLIIQPALNLTHTPQLKQLVTRLEKLPKVEYTELNMHWLQRLNAILQLMHRILYAVMILFALGVILIVFNTIRLVTQNYRDEIMVIKLLGGSNRFIRRPFLYSGIIYGLSGGIIAWFLIDIVLWFLESPVSKLAALYGSHFKLAGLGVNATLWLVVGGTFLGFIGSWLAVARHIRSIEPK